jgi:hypothetical protein
MKLDVLAAKNVACCVAHTPRSGSYKTQYAAGKTISFFSLIAFGVAGCQ